MKRSSRITVAAIVVVAIIGGFVLFQSPKDDNETADASGETAAAAVIVPTLSAIAIEGRIAFDENCAQCHGINGSGTNQGPPLIHIIYEPSHHADIAFLLAARNGTRAHHWQFGDMPAQPQVNEPEIAAIVQFVREVQRANGIF